MKSSANTRDFFRQATVLVTGAAGSLGSRLVASLLDMPVKAVRALDSDENGLHNLSLNIPDRHKAKVRLLVGDVRDPVRLRRAVDGVDCVYHLAALKHVGIGSYNPFEVVKTNVIGTENILDACLDAKSVRKFFIVSTDKAVNPKGTYGVSKLLSEELTRSASAYKGDRNLDFVIFRLGNIIGTRGSVWYQWGKQSKSGRPVTLTSKEMRRYFIRIDDAVDFILKSSPTAKDGETIIPKMKEFNMFELAKTISPQIVLTNPHSHEKLHEELMTADETAKAVEMPTCWVVK